MSDLLLGAPMTGGKGGKIWSGGINGGITREHGMFADASVGYSEAGIGKAVVAVPDGPGQVYFSEDKKREKMSPGGLEVALAENGEKNGGHGQLVRAASEARVPPIRIETFTGFTFKVYKFGRLYKPGEDRSPQALRLWLQRLLLPGISCSLSWKNSGDIVARGEVDGAMKGVGGGAMQIHLVGMVDPVTVLANMNIDVFDHPHFLDEDDEYGVRRSGRAGGRRAQIHVDPFPALTKMDVRKALSANGGKIGSYIVHTTQGQTSGHHGFKMLTISYVPESIDYADIESEDWIHSLTVHLVLPVAELPHWVPYAGYITLYSNPWKIEEPNPCGQADGIMMFKDVSSLKSRYSFLRKRLSPYPADAAIPIEVEKDHKRIEMYEKDNENENTRTLVGAEYKSGVAYQDGNDDDDMEVYDSLLEMKPRFTKKRKLILVALLLLVCGGVGGGLGWYFASRNNSNANPASPLVSPAPPAPPPAVSQRISFNTLVNGFSTSTWSASAQAAYLASLRAFFGGTEGTWGVQGIGTARRGAEEDFGGKGDAMALDVNVQTRSGWTERSRDAQSATQDPAWTERSRDSPSLSKDPAWGSQETSKLDRSSSPSPSRVLLQAVGSSSLRIFSYFTSTNVALVAQVQGKLVLNQTQLIQTLNNDLKAAGFNATFQAIESVVLTEDGSIPTSGVPTNTTIKPIQIILCSAFDPPLNGFVSPSTSVFPGQRVEISCDVGYHFNLSDVNSTASPLCLKSGVYENRTATCNACGAGQFVASQTGPCQPCPAGSYSTKTATSSCTLCAAGTYQNSTGATNCTNCTNNTRSATEGATSSSYCKCIPGYFSPSGGAPCEPCPKDTYANAEGSTNCSACPANAYTVGIAASVELACRCDKGYYPSSTNPLRCSPCPTGSYKFTQSNVQCSACPTNSNNTAAGQVNPQKCVCLPGYTPDWPLSVTADSSTSTYNESTSVATVETITSAEPFERSATDNDRASVTTSQNVTTTVTTTPVVTVVQNRTFLDENYVQATTLKTTTNITTVVTTVVTSEHRIVEEVFTTGAPLYRQTITDNVTTVVTTRVIRKVDSLTWMHAGLHRCIACSAGHITPMYNPLDLYASGCVLCAPGTYTGTPGSTCTDCTIGTSSNELRSACTLCPLGYFSPTNKAVSCTMCSAGKVTTVPGSSECTNCPDGKTSVAASSECTTCQPGTAAQGGSASCVTCQAGYYAGFQAAACSQCAAGRYSGTMASTCESCSAGTFSTAGSSGCAECLPGSYAGALASACTSCAPGKYSTANASSACTSCEERYFQEQTGATFCRQCPPSSSSAVGANASSQCVCNTGLTRAIDGVCVQYWASGVVYNLPQATLTSGGWRMCTEVQYNQELTVATMQQSCGSFCAHFDRMLFGARTNEAGSNLQLAAMASTNSGEKFNPQLSIPNPLFAYMTSQGPSAVALPHNGAFWYWTDRAFGFSAVQNITLGAQYTDVNATSCEGRLSWNVEVGGTGGRAGCVCSCPSCGTPNPCTTVRDLGGIDGSTMLKSVWCSL